MIKLFTLVTGVALFLLSCGEEKYIIEGNKYYKIETITHNLKPPEIGLSKIYLKIYQPKEHFKALVTDKGEYLILKPLEEFIQIDSIELPNTSGWKSEIEGKYYFPEIFDPNSLDNFTYYDSKPVLQALTIPIKIRPALNSPALLDSFPSQTETGFNAGLAFAWKFTYNSFNMEKNIMGSYFNRFSITPGLFLGAGAVDLKKSNTKEPPIKFERKTVMMSIGGFIMFGFNNINLGYAFGLDYATGIGASNWLYKGKLWHGFILGLDVLKL